ncbi:MAG: hypothetical protein K5660_06340 [Paludibacteraceae bacterium]|nr:hypothetical protein [Paludibacteraceae bacterium]
MKRFVLLFCIACFSPGIFAHTVTLISYQEYEKIYPLHGITKVTDMIYDFAMKCGAKSRVTDASANKIKNCLIFNCTETLERGKILNITNDIIIVHAKIYYENGSYKEENIKILPRTFSRLIGGPYVDKIVCSFDY